MWKLPIAYCYMEFLIMVKKKQKEAWYISRWNNARYKNSFLTRENETLALWAFVKVYIDIFSILVTVFPPVCSPNLNMVGEKKWQSRDILACRVPGPFFCAPRDSIHTFNISVENYMGPRVVPSGGSFKEKDFSKKSVCYILSHKLYTRNSLK